MKMTTRCSVDVCRRHSGHWPTARTDLYIPVAVDPRDVRLGPRMIVGGWNGGALPRCAGAAVPGLPGVGTALAWTGCPTSTATLGFLFQRRRG
ncbi:MAG: hypothetical protein JWO52_1139 [Gammaproteobacteria bacterium]|nr:hypothetical protein [Gammaproteobacteria bacterium]